MEAAVFDFEDAGGEAIDEVAIVRDEEDGAGEVANGVEEDIFCAEVEVVGGSSRRRKLEGETSILAMA